LSDEEMTALQAFLATVTFPPNPFRTMENELPDELDGASPLRGREIFLHQPIDEPDIAQLGIPAPFDNFLGAEGPVFTCVRCHALPAGTNRRITPSQLLSLPLSLKVPHLRNVYQKLGFFSRTSRENHRGFGLTHDGRSPGLDSFLHFPRFVFSGDDQDEQQRRDVIAFVMCFGTDTHAGVGRQRTLAGPDRADPQATSWIDRALALADDGQVGLVVHGLLEGRPRGWAYAGAGTFQSDRPAERIGADQLRSAALPGSELTWTVVPLGSQVRLGIDRDLDGLLNGED
jgi:hypothetical protein